MRTVVAGVARGGVALLRVGVALALLLALAGQWLLSPTVASAADTWTVQVGGGDDATGAALLAFFPDPLSIHAGDTVKFTFADPFHTVTFNSKSVTFTASANTAAGATSIPVGSPRRSRSMVPPGSSGVFRL